MEKTNLKKRKKYKTSTAQLMRKGKVNSREQDLELVSFSWATDRRRWIERSISAS